LSGFDLLEKYLEDFSCGHILTLILWSRFPGFLFGFPAFLTDGHFVACS